MVDEASVGQQGGAAEARQSSSLSSKQHQVTGGHLGEVSEAAGDTCSQRESNNNNDLGLIERKFIFAVSLCFKFLI